MNKGDFFFNERGTLCIVTKEWPPPAGTSFALSYKSVLSGQVFYVSGYGNIFNAMKWKHALNMDVIQYIKGRMLT